MSTSKWYKNTKYQVWKQNWHTQVYDEMLGVFTWAEMLETFKFSWFVQKRVRINIHSVDINARPSKGMYDRLRVIPISFPDGKPKSTKELSDHLMASKSRSHV